MSAVCWMTFERRPVWSATLRAVAIDCLPLATHGRVILALAKAEDDEPHERERECDWHCLPGISAADCASIANYCARRSWRTLIDGCGRAALAGRRSSAFHWLPSALADEVRRPSDSGLWAARLAGSRLQLSVVFVCQSGDNESLEASKRERSPRAQ